jgi:hypothetical protein
MPTKPLSALQAKLLRLALNSGAADGEALNAFAKLRASLEQDGPNPHELCDALQSAGFALAEEAPLPAAPIKPDYGLCKIPFGKNKGTLFMDATPFELRSIWRWCHEDEAKLLKFRDLVHDIEMFLGPEHVY